MLQVIKAPIVGLGVHGLSVVAFRATWETRMQGEPGFGGSFGSFARALLLRDVPYTKPQRLNPDTRNPSSLDYKS